MIYCSFIEAVQLYQEESAAKVRAVGQSEVGAISSLTVRSSAQWGDSDEF